MPPPKPKKSGHTNWILDDRKFLSPSQLRKLIRTTEKQKHAAMKKRTKTPVKDWFLICVATETGLRVQEITDLCCGDIQTLDGQCSVLVRNGKGGKPRIVHVRKEFHDKAQEFLEWKQAQGQSIAHDAPLFSAGGKRMTKRALQKSYARSIKRAGVVQARGVGIHSTRHTYASLLLKAAKFNLRLVQQQLGHASTRTTEVYAHIFDPEVKKAVGRLFG
jgi:integrase